MADAKAKTINLLLYEGDLEGVISIEDSSWNSGELYSAPRDSVSELLETDACKKYGVYLLLSKSMVYVGQSSDLSKRITQHTVGKDWWESVVILTTKDDSLTHSDIDYLFRPKSFPLLYHFIHTLSVDFERRPYFAAISLCEPTPDIYSLTAEVFNSAE